MSFSKDVERVEGLRGHYRKGLKALRKVDRARITIPSSVGSVNIDDALASIHPHEPRWDYVVGCKKGTMEVLLWIEVHPANGGHTIHEVESKLSWLLKWVKPTALGRYRRRFYWVSSGRSSFTVRDSRMRTLAQRGLIFCGKHLAVKKADI